jgi:hypothetical protein
MSVAVSIQNKVEEVLRQSDFSRDNIDNAKTASLLGERIASQLSM